MAKNPWKIPTNPFSMFKKAAPKYGQALKPQYKGHVDHKEAIEADEVEEDANGNVHVSDATSWSKETHPKGPGPSNLVDDIDYDETTKDLTVKYRDGFVAIYHNMSRGDVWTFATAESKGKWALQHLWNKAYDRG
jgi:hypothetical protein